MPSLRLSLLRSTAVLRSAAALVAMAASASAGHAQTVIDFGVNDGGFTRQAGSYNQWGYRAPGQGGMWYVLPQLSTTMRLLSPVFYATGGTSTITLEHTFNFYGFLGAGAPATCYDAGIFRLKTGAGAFAALAPSAGVGYAAKISSQTGNPDGGEDGFCGNVGIGAPVSSTWSFTAAAGTAIQFAFEGSWDQYQQGTGADDWELDRITLTGLATTAGGPVTTTPEPATPALIGAGLAGVAIMRRRRRV